MFENSLTSEDQALARVGLSHGAARPKSPATTSTSTATSAERRHPPKSDRKLEFLGDDFANTLGLRLALRHGAANPGEEGFRGAFGSVDGDELAVALRDGLAPGRVGEFTKGGPQRAGV